jgi:hypothetical protein
MTITPDPPEQPPSNTAESTSPPEVRDLNSTTSLADQSANDAAPRASSPPAPLPAEPVSAPPGGISDTGQAGDVQPAARASGQPVASGLAIKRRNAVTVWILWPLITLGIYHLVWYYKIHKEMAEFDRRRAIPVAGPMLVLIFLGWTVIAPIISYHNAGKRIRTTQTSAGLVASCSPALCWLLWFVFGLNTLYMQAQLNKVVDQYPGATPGTQVPLYV